MAEVGNGRIEFQFVEASAAAIVEGRGRRFELDRLGFVGDGAVELVCVAIRPAAKDVAIGVVGIEPDRLGLVGDRVGVVLFNVIRPSPVDISPRESTTFPFARLDRGGAGGDLFVARALDAGLSVIGASRECPYRSYRNEKRGHANRRHDKTIPSPQAQKRRHHSGVGRISANILARRKSRVSSRDNLLYRRRPLMADFVAKVVGDFAEQ